MRIGIAGAGAVGCVYGGSLAKAGYDVRFLARGPHLEAMNEHALHIKTDEESYVVEGMFTNDVARFSDVDLILFTVKSHHTEEMAKALKAVVKKDTLILTLQNGVDNEAKLVEWFGAARVLSAATFIQGKVTAPGVVELHGSTKMVLGALDERQKQKAKEITELFQEANVDAKYTNNIMEQKWRKFLWNITFNPLTALMEVQVGELLHNESLFEVAEGIFFESLAIANALRVDLDEMEMREVVFERNAGAEEHQTSMLQDRLLRRKMEVDALSGYIVRKGNELGIETPINQTVYQLLRYLNDSFE